LFSICAEKPPRDPHQNVHLRKIGWSRSSLFAVQDKLVELNKKGNDPSQASVIQSSTL
jgi:hypothetical protein